MRIQETASSMTAVEYKAHSRMAWTTSTGMHVSGPSAPLLKALQWQGFNGCLGLSTSCNHIAGCSGPPELNGLSARVRGSSVLLGPLLLQLMAITQIFVYSVSAG